MNSVHFSNVSGTRIRIQIGFRPLQKQVLQMHHHSLIKVCLAVRSFFESYPDPDSGSKSHLISPVKFGLEKFDKISSFKPMCMFENCSRWIRFQCWFLTWKWDKKHSRWVFFFSLVRLLSHCEMNKSWLISDQMQAEKYLLFFCPRNNRIGHKSKSKNTVKKKTPLNAFKLWLDQFM